MFSFVSRVRPYFWPLLLATLMLSAAGVYCAFLMPSGVYPEVNFPRIEVVAKAPGLDLTTQDLKVTRPLEEALATVIGVNEVRSKTQRAATQISITCAPGTDMNRALEAVWNHIGAVRSDLPSDVGFTVEQMSPSINPIMAIALTGGDDPAQLREYAYYQLAPRLKTISDVYRVEVAGGDVRQIEVIVRPEDLLAHGLSAADVADQIGQTSLLQPVGQVHGPPLGYQLLIDNQARTVRQIEDIKITVKGDRTLRLSDVADVVVGHEDRVQSIGYAQKEAVAVSVFRRVGGNTVNVSRDVHALIDKYGLTLPPGDPHKPAPRNIQATFGYDQSTFVEASVGNVRRRHRGRRRVHAC